MRRALDRVFESDWIVPLAVMALCFGALILAVLLDLHFRAHP